MIYIDITLIARLISFGPHEHNVLQIVSQLFCINYCVVLDKFSFQSKIVPFHFSCLLKND